MKELCLVVYDEDFYYVEEFIKFFNNNYGTFFRVIGVTSKSKLENLIYSGRTIDILLVNEELRNTSTEISMIKTVITLCENHRNNDLDIKKICKYQNGHAICSCIKKIYSSLNQSISFNKNEKMKVLTLFSPVGGVGKTTLSLLFAIRLTKEGKKVLLLNLEQISSLDIYFNTEDKVNTIADLFYRASESVEIGKETLNGIIKRDSSTNVYYINPVNSTLEIEDSTGNNLIYLLDSIKRQCDFDYVIVDSGSRLDNSLKRLGDYSDKFIGVLEPSNISVVKTKKLLDEFLNDENTILIVNKYHLNGGGKIFDEHRYLKDKIYSFIAYDNYLSKNESLEMLINAESINSKINEIIYKLMREEWVNE
ncbi:MAG: AAA family ATPase [Clostridium sp.]